MKQRKTPTEGQGGKFSLVQSFLKGTIPMFCLSITLDMLKTTVEMLTPQIIKIAVDSITQNGENSFSRPILKLIEFLGGMSYIGKHLIILSLGLVAVAVSKSIFEYASIVTHTRASETLIKNMRDSIYKRIQHLPFSWHMKNHTGDIIQRCTSDIETFKFFIAGQLKNILCILFYLLLTLAFMIPMDPLLTLYALIPVPVIIFSSVIFHRKIRRTFRACDETEAKLSNITQENLTGVRVVRAFGKESLEKEKFEKQNDRHAELLISLGSVMGSFQSVSTVLSKIQTMIVVVIGAVFCVSERITPGEYIAFISYKAMLNFPVRMLSRMISEFSKARVSLNRICYIMNAEIETDREGAACADMTGDISFENVSFSYEEGAEILKDINLDIKAGTTLGILGGTGSGKSTLLMLLDKLYDLPEGCGKITVGGVDIRDIKTEHLRKNIGMVLQEPYLFSRTIAENIGIADSKINLEEIREAARDACLDDTVAEFSKGYDTFVGERGVTLSGGQKQRAAIARTLTSKAPIMIFDDSLSAVDTETDAKIREALEKRFGSATIIIISHRITTLSKADKIVVMDGGRIIEQGTPEELKNLNGVYKKIYDIQSSTEQEVLE